MVGFPRPNHADYSIRNISGWLQSHCQSLKTQFSIEFEIHFQDGLENCLYSPQLPGLLEAALLQASLASPKSSTIEVAAHMTRRGIEFEIVAQCNAEYQEESLKAFCRERSLIGQGFSLATYRARCPDGSVAWIIVQTTAARLRQSA
jgi:hypothetical protein